ncbi:hypothetical protein [Thermomonospora amylolytica]|uniref:hypothetical protein n=1 Tax=Thermomonospora amylolytica TaxID=1411117 RepID=UPI001300596C|nr:hypothetical protein [Thermomonospora amylolytica]
MNDARCCGRREPDVTDAVRALHGYVLLETGDESGVQISRERAPEALHVTLQNWPS